jgi:hypothetical protein
MPHPKRLEMARVERHDGKAVHFRYRGNACIRQAGLMTPRLGGAEQLAGATCGVPVEDENAIGETV